MKTLVFLAAVLLSSGAMAKNLGNDILMKLKPGSTLTALKAHLPAGSVVEDLGGQGWVRVEIPAGRMQPMAVNALKRLPGVLGAENNAVIHLDATWKVTDATKRAQLQKIFAADPAWGSSPADNPPIQLEGSGGSGPDPLVNQQWGMIAIGAPQAWTQTNGDPRVIVAVIDTGVDYNHEDLVDNIWHNPGEMGTDAQGRDKASNAVDDDSNGYVDDVIGWDFVDNDNKPYDLTTSVTQMLLSGGNPGHGTHCAGNVAARAGNGKGVAGVAPGVRIMPVRFISSKGQGTTADAIKAINYAVKMGAKVLSNSWGGEGSDQDPEAQALQDAITAAMNQGVLFVAAAGNGHNDQGVGYDNDTDPSPSVPASYAMDNIISVAAVDQRGQLASFSNWGANSVDIAAPGVQIFSTVATSQKYSDTIINILGVIKATWDGTSMATPMVSGAAALYMSLHPEATWQQTKQAILATAKPNPALQGKMVSGGELDVLALSRY